MLATATADQPATGASRRAFIAGLLATPTLAIAAKFDLDQSPWADAGLLGGDGPLGSGLIGSPEASDLVDLGDLLIAAEAANQYDLVLEVLPENVIRFQLPRIEKGQGVSTAVAMMVAEELDARVEDVRVELSDARLDGPFTLTGSSSTVRAMWGPARAVAAAARARLVTAAAQQFGVPADRIVTRETRAFSPDGRSLSYGELSGAAARVAVPAVPRRPSRPIGAS
jgi:isoquinoline 1-oxidoreductase beta subunit